MAALDTATTPVVCPKAETAATPRSVRLAAIGLWGVVGTLLGYGVLQTTLKAAALLT